LALQCLHIMLQCAEHVDMWSEKAQIRLVNYCCTLLHKSVLDDEDDDDYHRHQKELNHLIYAEQHFILHSLTYAILTFLSVVRCRKEIGTFYRENEHFRELLSAMRHKYGSRSEFQTRDPSIGHALSQVTNMIFDRQQRRKRRHHFHSSNPSHQSVQPSGDFRKHPRNDPFHFDDDEQEDNRTARKCSNSLCQMIENDQMQFQFCPHCRHLSYCSQYCREVHWTLNHHLSCRANNSSNGKKDESTVLCVTDRYTGQPLQLDREENTTVSMSHNSAFETLPVHMSKPMIEATADVTNELCHPSTSSTSSTTAKKKSFKTLLSLLRVGTKRR